MNCTPFRHPSFIEPGCCRPNVSPSVKPDAIVVPTRRADSAFLHQIEALSAAAHEIWVLPTGPAAQTLNRLCPFPNNVRCFSHLPWEDMQRWFLQFPSSRNPSSASLLDYDLPLKRNTALRLAHMAGVERICLLDDDIHIDPGQIACATASLTRHHPLAGFYVFDFPDVSTLEHVDRLTTGTSVQTLPGGNCLFILLSHANGFFPYIYNEDWLYVLHNLRSVAGLALGHVHQQHHAPWEDHPRIRFEEFGEVIIRGLLCLPNGFDAPEAVSPEYWQQVLEHRHSWLVTLLGRCAPTYSLAVRTALHALHALSFEDCIGFISSLRKDWQEAPWAHIPLNHVSL